MPPALRAWHSSPQIHVFLENLHQDVPTRVNLIDTLQAHEPGPQRPHRHPSSGTHTQVGQSHYSQGRESMRKRSSPVRIVASCPGGSSSSCRLQPTLRTQLLSTTAFPLRAVGQGRKCLQKRISPVCISSSALAGTLVSAGAPHSLVPPLSHRPVLPARTPLVCLVAWTGSSLGGGCAHRCADELERYFNILETGWPFCSRSSTCRCDDAPLWAGIVATQRALSADELERFSNNTVSPALACQQTLHSSAHRPAVPSPSYRRQGREAFLFSRIKIHSLVAVIISPQYLW